MFVYCVYYYLDYTRRKVLGYVPEWAKLWEVWVEPEKRRTFLDNLRRASIHVEVLAEVLGQPEADQFDLLAHIAYGRPVRTRSERARAFETREGTFLGRYHDETSEGILALLDKYRVGGVEQLADPRVFRLSPFREMGQMPGVIRWFEGWLSRGELMRSYATDTCATTIACLPRNASRPSSGLRPRPPC